MSSLDTVSKKLSSEKSKAEEEQSRHDLYEIKKYFEVESKEFFEIKEGERFHLVSCSWINCLIHFLNGLENDFSSKPKTFERSPVLTQYFYHSLGNEIDDRHLGSFPGPINNYSIVDFKNYLFDPVEKYLNGFLKKNLKENVDYVFLKESIYDKLERYFGSNYRIERFGIKFNNEDIIEVELKRFKIILLSRELDEKHSDLITPRNVQISKLATFSDFKKKVLRSLPLEKVYEVKLFVPSFIDLNKKKILFEIIYSYHNKAPSFRIKGSELTANDTDLIQVNNPLTF